MNRDELSRMLDLVDEKYLNEALGNESAYKATVSADGTDTVTFNVTSTVPAVKRRSMGSGLACIAAALALVIGLTVLTNPGEISVDEGQGAVTDSETVTDIIETDETEIEPYDYGDLFCSPVDLGMRGFDCNSDDEAVYYYNGEYINDLFPESAAALLNGRFNAYVSVSYDDSGEISAANISLTTSDSFLYKLDIFMEKDYRLWNSFYYSGKTERLGKNVQSCYCEKSDGLHLWAYVPNGETNYALYSLGFEREEAALILDSIITSGISFDGFTPDNADGMWQNMTLEQAAALPEFKGKVCTEKNPGDKFLRSENIVFMRLLYKGEAYSSSFAVVYDDSADVNRSVSVGYSNNGKASANITTVDIGSVTPEKITELCRSDEDTFCINADGVYVTVSGVYSPGFLKALTDHLKTVNG